MKPEILQKWQEAAKELWGKSPELRSRYNFDLQAYLNLVRLRIVAQEEWNDNPQTQKEFGMDFDRFLTYRCHEAAGDIAVITGAGIS